MNELRKLEGINQTEDIIIKWLGEDIVLKGPIEPVETPTIEEAKEGFFKNALIKKWMS